MTQEEIKNRYLEWMYGIVCDDQYTEDLTYHKLFDILNSTEFYYSIPMDGNRAEDGVNLRYRFGDNSGIDHRIIASELDDHPCSVLEMMIALALRIEDSIMDNPDIGNRVGQWFWEMIVSLGLGGMNDRNFDVDFVDDKLRIFLNREYDRDGNGGLFHTSDSSKDMRNTEIWYQMHSYLNELLEN